MRAERMELRDFRNLRETVWQPGPGINVIWGENAQGKTNLLEALWLFTGSKSFRGARDRELIALSQTEAQLNLAFYAEDRRQEAAIKIGSRRTADLNGIPQSSASSLAGHFCGVVFSPAHLTLIKGGPEERRRFVDAAYCQLRPGYLGGLREYMRALAQRNNLLKDCRGHGDLAMMLDVWDQRLAMAGARLLRARSAYIARLQPAAIEIYRGLSAGKEAFDVRYRPAGEGLDALLGQDDKTLASALYQLFGGNRDADIAAGFTTAGPHRDDLEVEIAGLPARVYGSQGQQRSAVLALKLAEATLLRTVTGEQPVALLDDVMSELDASRQDYILNHIHDWQVFVTCCDPEPLRRMEGGVEFHMKQGVLEA